MNQSRATSISYLSLFLSVVCLCTLMLLIFMVKFDQSPQDMQIMQSRSSFLRNLTVFSSRLKGTLVPSSENDTVITPSLQLVTLPPASENSTASKVLTKGHQLLPVTRLTDGQELNRTNNRIVFLKTHKTASTTLASIFERYGYYRNLTFAVGRGHILSFQYKFSRKAILKFPGMEGKPFDMLTNHARYNRPEMDAVVPNATYVTILRKPEDQLDSAFGYFEMYKDMKLGNESNPLQAFMDDPMRYYTSHKYHMWQLSRNGMLYDLGFDHKYDEDEQKIVEKISEIDREFDLVMLSDFFDESLILLKNLLSWEFDDILYLSCGIRSASHRFENNASLLEKIRNWSHGDVLLYNHFNNTFWKKVVAYGPNFTKDLNQFRILNQSVFDDCINQNKTIKSDRRVEKLTLKNNSEKCKSLLRGDVDYTPMIRKSMKERFGTPPQRL